MVDELAGLPAPRPDTHVTRAPLIPPDKVASRVIPIESPHTEKAKPVQTRIVEQLGAEVGHVFGLSVIRYDQIKKDHPRLAAILGVGSATKIGGLATVGVGFLQKNTQIAEVGVAMTLAGHMATRVADRASRVHEEFPEGRLAVEALPARFIGNLTRVAAEVFAPTLAAPRNVPENPLAVTALAGTAMAEIAAFNMACATGKIEWWLAYGGAKALSLLNMKLSEDLPKLKQKLQNIDIKKTVARLFDRRSKNDYSYLTEEEQARRLQKFKDQNLTGQALEDAREVAVRVGKEGEPEWLAKLQVENNKRIYRGAEELAYRHERKKLDALNPTPDLAPAAPLPLTDKQIQKEANKIFVQTAAREIGKGVTQVVGAEARKALYTKASTGVIDAKKSDTQVQPLVDVGKAINSKLSGVNQSLAEPLQQGSKSLLQRLRGWFGGSQAETVQRPGAALVEPIVGDTSLGIPEAPEYKGQIKEVSESTKVFGLPTNQVNIETIKPVRNTLLPPSAQTENPVAEQLPEQVKDWPESDRGIPLKTFNSLVDNLGLNREEADAALALYLKKDRFPSSASIQAKVQEMRQIRSDNNENGGGVNG